MIDVLILGAGGAGLTSAIEAKRNGANVAILSKTYPTVSQTSQAQGGINACINEAYDKVENHIKDTLKSSHKIGNEDVINFMCQNAKDTIKWLDDLAVPFSKDENGNIAQRKLGGASVARACYSSDYTGLKILHTLYDTCLRENIKFYNEYMLLNFIIENNIVVGVSVLNIKTTKVEQFLAKKIIIATGGYSGIYTNFNTNSYSTTGDGIAAALRAGCKLSNMEYIQFHPTALSSNCILISESARGEGGYLVTKDGKRFVDELLPRDEVARAIYKKIQQGDEVFLDLRHFGKEKIMATMPQEYNLALQYLNLKMDEDLIPIKPAAHYSMGGIQININCETNIKNLYAVGECANNGVHGANRLGGNSLLEIILFGRVVGKKASEDLDDINIINKNYNVFKNDIKYIKEIFNFPNKINFYKRKELLGKELYDNVGLFKKEDNLNNALKIVIKWQNEFKNMGITDKGNLYNTNLKEFLEFKNMIDIAQVVVLSALNRKESRGAHYRLDYIAENEDYEKQSIIIKQNDKVLLELV